MLIIMASFSICSPNQARGICMACAPCGKEDGSLQCCDCWISCAEACNCCAYPNVKSCLDSLCGPPDDVSRREKRQWGTETEAGKKKFIILYFGPPKKSPVSGHRLASKF